MSNKQPAKLAEVIRKYSSMSVKDYTSTLYDSQGKLLDDGIDAITERLYWDSFVDPKQARELKQQLLAIERADALLLEEGE